MSYLVSLQEVDMPWGFTHAFTANERALILSAVVGVQFKLNEGSAHLHADGDLMLTLKSPGGFSHHCVNYAKLREQLLDPDSVTLYERHAH
ncbi:MULTISPECIES: hypothetical protein [unclassified Duganella]|uniref:hypothetical protein n=1 Tax=unclassified Duganella TaxID=2636909 RepID=UPI000892669E|nr:MULTISPECIES: hypothetical protein [unclassified Duganella]SDF81138.1 hypothetical protein SAMN05216320_1011396 [Duganella sp. OV458]SDI48264.1 hypothetical protein SAMN05428973_10119 [Duganella sp. OV510]